MSTHKPTTKHSSTPRLLHRLDDETGAQAMEYAMLGGAGVASVSVLTWLIRQDWFEEAMREFFTGLLESLSRTVFDLLPSFGGVL